MTKAEHTLLMLLRAWLAHRRSGWTHPNADFSALCRFVLRAHYVFCGVTDYSAACALAVLRTRLEYWYCPFGGWDGHANPHRVAWARKVIKELEAKQ